MSEYSNISPQMFVLVNCSYSIQWKTHDHISVPSPCFSSSLSVCLVLPFLQSLRGNLLGIAPLLSSPLPGCCCRLYSVTTVCTQPGAPSNATSLTYTPHGGPNATRACMCVLNTHTSCLPKVYCHSYICVCTNINPWSTACKLDVYSATLKENKRKMSNSTTLNTSVYSSLEWLSLNTIHLLLCEARLSQNNIIYK